MKSDLEVARDAKRIEVYLIKACLSFVFGGSSICFFSRNAENRS
jgi:hypothetical protein